MCYNMRWRVRVVTTGVCDFLPFPDQRTLYLATGRRWSDQVAQYDRNIPLKVEVLQSDVAIARVSISTSMGRWVHASRRWVHASGPVWRECCEADGSTHRALKELVRRLPTYLYFLSIDLYVWELVRSVLCSSSRTVETLELNLGCKASGLHMLPLARGTSADNLSCNVLRLRMDCTDVDQQLLKDLFLNICMPRSVARFVLKNVASKETLESVFDIVYHRWLVGPSRPTELALTVSLPQQTDQQWARMRHDMTSFLAMKTDWQLMNVRVHLVIRSRRRVPLFLAAPRFV